MLAAGQTAAQIVNAEKPGTIDPTTLNDALAGGINTAFSVAKLVHAEHGAPVTATGGPA